MTATMYRLEMRRKTIQPATGHIGSLGMYPTLDAALTGMGRVTDANPDKFEVVDAKFRLVVKAV